MNDWEAEFQKLIDGWKANPCTTVYRFRSLAGQSGEYTHQEIGTGKIWMSLIDRFNDPYDSMSFTSEPNIAEKYEKQQGEHLKKFGIDAETFNLLKRQYLVLGHNYFARQHRIACFSRRNDSPLMWSHYADNHKGICLEYKIPEEQIQFFYPVNYRDRLLRWCERDVEAELLDPVKWQCLNKFKDWEYEQEIRAIKEPLFLGDEDKNVFLEGVKIQRILLGAKIAEDEEECLRATAPDLNLSQGAIVKMKMSDDDFRMVEES